MCEGVCEGVCMCEVCYEFNYAICTMSKGPDVAKFVSSWKAIFVSQRYSTCSENVIYNHGT